MTPPPVGRGVKGSTASSSELRPRLEPPRLNKKGGGGMDEINISLEDAIEVVGLTARRYCYAEGLSVMLGAIMRKRGPYLRKLRDVAGAKRTAVENATSLDELKKKLAELDEKAKKIKKEMKEATKELEDRRKKLHMTVKYYDATIKAKLRDMGIEIQPITEAPEVESIASEMEKKEKEEKKKKKEKKGEKEKGEQ